MNRRWSLPDAVEFWRFASPFLNANGFLCGIYGSVLHQATGRDLDLLVIPKRINTSIDVAAKGLAELCNGELEPPYDGIMGTTAYILRLPDASMVDLQFYKPSGARDAEELFIESSKRNL